MSFFTKFLSLICPAIIFFMTGRFLCGMVALGLQASLAGWVPAIIWARSSWLRDWEDEKKFQEEEERLAASRTPPPAPQTVTPPTAPLIPSSPEQKARME